LSDDVRKKILLEFAGRRAIITLNSPETLNALDIEGSRQLLKCLRKATAQEPTVVILKSGARAFCSGGNVKSMHSAGDRRAYLKELTAGIHACVKELRTMPVPVIAEVDGFAGGAGFALMLACDIIVATDRARFNTAFLTIGAAPGCGTWFYTRFMSYHQAAEAVFTCRTMDAAEGKRLGFINHVVSRDELAAKVDELAGQIESRPARALTEAKRLLNLSYLNTLETHLEMESGAISDSGLTEEFHEGVSAFVEKRKADFMKLRK